MSGRDNKLHLGVIAAIALTTVLTAPTSASAAKVEAVHIVSRVGNGDLATDRPKRARRDQGVELFGVLEVRDGRKSRYFADIENIQIDGKKHQTRPLSEAPIHVFTWWRVEPTTEDMSNTATGRFRFERIKYQETPIWTGLGRGRMTADVRPTLTADRGKGLGTMRYQVRAVTGLGATLRSAGREAHAGRGRGGLSDDVHRVSLRADDSYIGFLTEMYGQPYIWASAGTTARRHQSELLEGSDCADFVTYGWRRMGHRIPYTWTEGLRKFTKRIGRAGEPDEKGVYRDSRGRPLPFSARGDLVLFPRHVGVLVEDRGVKGTLDEADVMFHTLFKSPEMEEIRRTPYAGRRVELLRWRGRHPQ